MGFESEWERDRGKSQVFGNVWGVEAKVFKCGALVPVPGKVRNRLGDAAASVSVGTRYGLLVLWKGTCKAWKNKEGRTQQEEKEKEKKPEMGLTTKWNQSERPAATAGIWEQRKGLRKTRNAGLGLFSPVTECTCNVCSRRATVCLHWEGKGQSRLVHQVLGGEI